jgi:hypothetical protein
VLGKLHHPLESPAVEGGAVAVPGGDTEHIGGASAEVVRVLGAKLNFFSLLRLKRRC